MNVIGMIASYGQGRQDLLLNPLAFGLKLIALLRIRARATGVPDKTSELLLGASDHINSSRFTLRFLVGLANVHALLTEKAPAKPTPTEAAIARVRTLQRVLNIGYNIAELLAYAKMVAPKAVAVDGAHYGRVSCRIWLVNMLLDVYCIAKQQLALGPKAGMTTATKTTLLANACDIVLALNWSIQNPFLGELPTAILGTLSGVIYLAKSWSALVDEHRAAAAALASSASADAAAAGAGKTGKSSAGISKVEAKGE